MSGIAGLLLGFAAKFWKNDRVPDSWLWATCILCFIFAVFRAWSQEFDRAELAQAEAINQPDLTDVLAAQQRLSNAAIPRTLSQAQRDCLRRLLEPVVARARVKGATLQVILVATEGWDSADYALEFESFLGSIGFKVSRYRLSGEHEGDDYRRGIWFRWSTEREKQYNSSFGREFVGALSACEINVIASDHVDWPHYELIIGARRP
ncbi:MAG: hypothetical protein H7Y20_01430 [Bryobacteraceae bacterium]|nr:hypothetical protein [Bryobacteraceae bacterium]